MDNFENIQADSATGVPTKKKKTGIIVLISFIAVIVILLGAAGVGAALIYNKACAEVHTEAFSNALASSKNLIYEVAEPIILTGNANIKEDSLNSLLSSVLFDKSSEKNSISVKGFSVTDMAVELHKDSPSRIYARISKDNANFTVAANMDIDFDSEKQQLEMDIGDVTVGELTVPQWILNDYILKDENVRKIFSGASLEGNSKIVLPLNSILEKLDSPVSLTVNDIKTSEASLEISMERPFAEMQDKISALLDEPLEDVVHRVLTEVLEDGEDKTMKEVFSEFMIKMQMEVLFG